MQKKISVRFGIKKQKKEVEIIANLPNSVLICIMKFKSFTFSGL